MTEDEEPTVRQHLHQAIQNTVGLPLPDGDLGDPLPDGSMLMGWVTIAEWMSPAGDRWLSKIEGSASGQRPPTWQIQGYLHNGLHEGWDQAEEDDE